MRRLVRSGKVYAVERTVSHMAFEVPVGRMRDELAGQARLVGRSIAPKDMDSGVCGSRRRCSGVLTNAMIFNCTTAAMRRVRMSQIEGRDM